MSDFKFGVYEHYKGGRYTAFMLVRHHDTGLPMVVYVSHEKGTINVRPLHGWSNAGDGNDGPSIDLDGFLDDVFVNNAEDGGGIIQRPRFWFVGT